MTLEELLRQATPLPWMYATVVERFAAFDTRPEPDALLATHAINMLPKLVAALEECITDHDSLAFVMHGYAPRLDAITELAQAALKEATNPNSTTT